MGFLLAIKPVLQQECIHLLEMIFCSHFEIPTHEKQIDYSFPALSNCFFSEIWSFGNVIYQISSVPKIWITESTPLRATSYALRCLSQFASLHFQCLSAVMQLVFDKVPGPLCGSNSFWNGIPELNLTKTTI